MQHDDQYGGARGRKTGGIQRFRQASPKKYNMSNYNVGDVITLSNGSPAKVVSAQRKDGTTYKRLQITGAPRAGYLDEIRRLPRRSVMTPSGRKSAAPVSSLAVAKRLLREYYARKFPGSPKLATRAMRLDMSRRHKDPKKTLTLGTPESAHFRGINGPGYFDIKGLDDASQVGKHTSRVLKGRSLSPKAVQRIAAVKAQNKARRG